MRHLKALGVLAAGVGTIVLAPVALPALAAAGTTVLAAAGTAAAAVGTATSAAVATVGAGAAAAAGAVGAAAGAAGTAIASSAVGTAGGTAAGAVGAAAGAAGSAIASSAVGTAVGGAMATVGTVVGTAAGTLASAGGAVGAAAGAVAAATGSAAGATAIGTIATAGTVGATSAASGAGKMKRASDLSYEARRVYACGRKSFDETEAEMNIAMENLGRQKIEIWKQFHEYEDLISRIHNLKGEAKLEGKLSLDKDKLESIHLLAVSARNVVKDGGIALGTGSLIGVAASTGITSVATASTGTAIATLHGAAATNASLAALGGGSLASGGLGMAGGTVVGGVLTFAPAVAIGGLILNSQGSKSLKAAEASMDEAERLARSLAHTEEKLKRVQKVATDLSNVLLRFAKNFGDNLDWMRELTDRECNFELYSEDEQCRIFDIKREIEILHNLTTKELYSTEKDDIVIHSAGIEKAIEDAVENWPDSTEATNSGDSCVKQEQPPVAQGAAAGVQKF